jgi:hypothetical protein
MTNLYHHVVHPHVAARRKQGPVTVAGQLPRGNAAERFNTRAALLITRSVGTMWCAYVFAAIDMLALPTAIQDGLYGIVQWVASFFLQLVLLSIIMVGQDVQAKAADKRNDQSFNDVEAILHEQAEMAAHLAAQDDKIMKILQALDIHTDGGLKDVLDAIAALSKK